MHIYIYTYIHTYTYIQLIRQDPARARMPAALKASEIRPERPRLWAGRLQLVACRHFKHYRGTGVLRERLLPSFPRKKKTIPTTDLPDRGCVAFVPGSDGLEDGTMELPTSRQHVTLKCQRPLPRKMFHIMTLPALRQGFGFTYRCFRC